MFKFLLGTIFGIAVATVGLGGMAKVADSAVGKVKETVRDVAK